MLAWIEATTGITNYAVIFTVAFAVAVSLSRSPCWRGVPHRRRPATWRPRMTNFARFGYALIPLDVAAHLAHNLFHLLAEGGSVFYTVAALFGAAPADGATALASPARSRCCSSRSSPSASPGRSTPSGASPTAATAAAARRRATPPRTWCARRPARVVNVYLFLLPMAHRM